MDLVEKILSYLLFIVCLDFNSQVSCSKCILQNSNYPDKAKLLDSISLLTGVRYLTAKNGFSYAVSVCSDIGNHPNASVTRVLRDKNTTTVLGRYNETDIIGLGEHQILLTYSGGDAINESSTYNNTKWRTLIFISCDYNADDINIDLLDPFHAASFALFHLKTPVVCPARKSPFLTWLLVIFVLISAYFVCGILYKRYAEGAKGWEQVPHQEFWRNPLQHLMICLRGKANIQMPRNQPNDPADEPLLRP